MSSTPWFYTDRVSAIAGEKVGLHISAADSPCDLIISRVGATTDEVARISNIETQSYAIPENADSEGCGWPVGAHFEVGADWLSGYYDLKLVSANGESSQHFICVKNASTSNRRKAVLILATNTYAAYNYWGGSNAYADVEALMAGELSDQESQERPIGRLSRQRPFPQLQLASPADAPRLINMQVRGKDEPAFPGDLEWMVEHRPSPYDGAACFIEKWEHKFVRWAEEQGYEFDFMTDHDFVTDDPALLAGYDAAFVVGHSEYWSGEQRRAIEAFVDAGGNFGVFSGNTCYWKVRWEDEGNLLVAHKWRGEQNDPLWQDENTRADATHLWSHDAFASPEAELLGISFVYGGYHRLCMCAARGAAAYTIYDDQHWALDGTDLYYGDLLGANVPLIGYENDGCPIQFGKDGLPKPDGGNGVPQNLEIIGIAPATLAEPDRSPFPKMIPQEESPVRARIAYGADDEKTIDRLMRGHAVLASFKKGEGEVFNSGTTEWAHGLAASDPFVEKITHNVLQRFGVKTSAGKT